MSKSYRPVKRQCKEHAIAVLSIHALLIMLTRCLNQAWVKRPSGAQHGGHAMPTIGTFIQLLPANFKSAPYRATDASIFVCVEGKGSSRIGDTLIEWGPRDIFVVPSWQSVVHNAEAETVLFSYSDRPVQEKLGLWRESRGNL